jgi:protoporphyrinogen oxidase
MFTDPSLERQHWGIVGGGMLGMTLARRLAQRGYRVTLLEAAGQLGGLASAWQLGDVVWDRHYHVTLLSDTYLRALLAELDLEKEMQWVETRTGFYTEGKLYSMSNTLEFFRFPPLSWWDKLRLAATIFHASRVQDWKKLERIPATDWLKKWSGKNTYEKIWKPLLRAKLGDKYQQASAAFIWASIARMYAARRTGLKKEMFGYVPGGYARILARFAEELRQEDVQIKLRFFVKRVEAGHRGKVVVETASGHHETFDQVVLTMPAPVVANVCPALSPAEKFKLNNVQYLGIVCPSLLLRRPLTNFYVTNITDSWAPFTGVIEMAALVDRRHFGGNALIYLPKYAAPDDPAFLRSDEEIENKFVPALQRMCPDLRPSEVLCFRVSRARYVFALSTLNYSNTLPPMTTSLPGVHIVNSAHIVNGTLNVNETLQLVERALPLLLAKQSAGHLRPANKYQGALFT